MRNIMLTIAAGSILVGCLGSEDSSFNGDSKNAANTTGNSSPTIAGSPASATMFGEMYEFVPNASDPDGDTLSFAVQNKPKWASFLSSTGKLYGQPTLADVGEYNDIVISVSDGSSSVSLPAFAVAVTESALGSVTLSWVAPTQNSDGSALTDLAGYKIYYRKGSGSYIEAAWLDNAGITTYVVEQLSPATYAFAATALNSAGVESSFSGEVTRTVQ